MSKLWVIFATLVLVMLGLTGCTGLSLGGLNAANTNSSRPTAVKVGDLAPEINLTSMTGDSIVLSKLEGRPVLVNF